MKTAGNTVNETVPAEERDFGEFRTRRLVLDAYDAMAAAVIDGGHGWTSLVEVPADAGPRHVPHTTLEFRSGT
jgi:hypothetical protein